jgi:hypothetical protein
MSIEAMKQALDALNEVTGWTWAGPMRVMDEVEDAITTLNQAIAEAGKQDHIEQHLEMVEQEPTCKQGSQVWVISNGKGAGQFSWEPQDEKFWTRMVPANTHPPKRVVFPTMLRKMWSGAEVQAWLDEHLNK